MILKTVIKIDEEILKKVNCKKNLSCLSGTDICKVELCIDGKIHFIKCINLEPCHHRILFERIMFIKRYEQANVLRYER